MMGCFLDLTVLTQLYCIQTVGKTFNIIRNLAMIEQVCVGLSVPAQYDIINIT